jgi:hypothetical protein
MSITVYTIYRTPTNTLPLANAMDEATPDHGGMVVAMPGAPTLQTIINQIESMGSTSGSPRA